MYFYISAQYFYPNWGLSLLRVYTVRTSGPCASIDMRNCLMKYHNKKCIVVNYILI